MSEIGRSARIKAEKAARQQAEEITRQQNTAGFFHMGPQLMTDEQKAYADRKYLAREKVTKRSHESHLPETRKLTTGQIRDRIGEFLPTSRDVLGMGTLQPLHPSQCQVRKSDLNVPCEDVRPKPKGKARGEYDPTSETGTRDGGTRPNLCNTVRKAKNTPEPGIGRRAWKNLTDKERAFSRSK